MANTKISALTAATTPVAGTEVLPIVQSGATVKVAVSDLTAGRNVSTANLTATGTANASYTGAKGVVVDYASSSTGVVIPIGFSWSSSIGNQNPYWGMGLIPISFAAGTADLGFYCGGNERMRIASGGTVTMSAYGVGTATFSASGVISSVSDETWKIKDGVPVDPDSMLKKLEPGYWYYNDEKKEIFGVDRQLGFYAQNVNAAIGPEAAPTPGTIISKAMDGTDIVTTKPWGYYDRSVLAVTVMSLQKALATIESLTARIEALEAR